MSTELTVKKTYKHFVGGQFIRSESGRTERIMTPDGTFVTHVCAASRKDLRSAVEKARKSESSWAAKTAYNRGQILYRIAEVLSYRMSDFVDELTTEGFGKKEAKSDVQSAIDLWVSFAGWTDKYSSLFSSVNPVASPHFNFSVPEPVGTVGLFMANTRGIKALTSGLAPVLAGGNTAVILIPSHGVLANLTMAEVLHTSDVPAGVVNLLSCPLPEVASHLASHRDLNSVAFWGLEPEQQKEMQQLASSNMKRIRFGLTHMDTEPSPYEIMAYQEVKTTWHPIGL
jgi:acyl-CoA reductase-like NAD-dependent aldehyde dehydrogenase